MYRRNIRLNSFVATLLTVLLIAPVISSQSQPKSQRPSAFKRGDPRTREYHEPNRGPVAKRRGLRDLISWEGLPGDEEWRNAQLKTTGQEGDKPDSAGVPTETRTEQELEVDTQQSNATGQQAAGPNHTIVVHSTDDDGPGTLRRALAIASDGDKINIVARGTITLTSGELVVDKSLTIRGPGKANAGVSGNGTSRVFYIAPNTTVNIEGLKITNGRTVGDFPANAGGAIHSDHAQLTLRDCTIIGNSARFGGGIFSNSFGGGNASLTLVNTTVTGNSAEFGFGGGIFSGGGFLSEAASGDAALTLENSTVSNNSAVFGGGILNDGSSGHATATINRSDIVNNIAVLRNQGSFVAGGGGIYNNGDSGVATLRLTRSIVSGNTAGDVPIETTDEDGEPAFIFNNGNGGGIYNDGLSSVREGNAQITLVTTLVSGNAAHGDEVEDGPAGNGGGIYNNGSFGNATATLDNSTLEGNQANTEGGGIRNLSTSGSATVTLNDCTLKSNSAVNRDAPPIAATNAGGGISNLGDSGDATLTLIDCRVTDNVAGLINQDGPQTGSGGGLRNFGHNLGNANLMLTNTVLNRNAAGSGGAIATGGFGTLSITHCDLNDNLAGAGGAISGAGSVTITDSTILRNRAQSAGGIFNGSNGGFVTMTITNCIIHGNYGGALGGGILNIVTNGGFAILNVDKSTVSDNHAASGGGICNFGDRGSAIATITNSTLSGNAANVDPLPFATEPPGGGAVFNSNIEGGSSTVKLTNCTISGNSTRYTGGAIQNVIQNQSEFDPLATSVSLDNCTLNGNSADQGGNSIWNEAKIVEDNPQGNPAVDFANTIMNDGTAGGNIQNRLGTVTSRGYNLSSDDGGGFLTGPGDLIHTNPWLGPLRNNGGPTRTHALLLNSPAINAGDPNFNPQAFQPPLLYDQRGGPVFPRVVNGRVDIGAFEARHP
jgi:hypothetical protein